MFSFRYRIRMSFWRSTPQNGVQGINKFVKKQKIHIFALLNNIYQRLSTPKMIKTLVAAAVLAVTAVLLMAIPSILRGRNNLSHHREVKPLNKK